MMRRIVIRVGGSSLFHPHGFQSELSQVLHEFEGDQVLLICGGGDLIESMRSLHRIYPALSEEEMHWRCVELLDYTWSVARELFPTKQSIFDARDLTRWLQWSPNGTTWVRVQSFYNRCGCESICADWLPKPSWETTSDALAWLLAKVVRAQRVILLKRCECDSNWTLEQAAAMGIVDSELARLYRLEREHNIAVELRSMV